MRCALIVAVAENRVIGINNQMPWYIPADLKYFKKITMGKPLLMGRKTFDSLGKPLPGRPHIVISRDKNFQFPEVEVRHSLEEGLDLAKTTAESMGLDEFMVIGGANIYQQLLPKVDRMYLTQVHANFEGDAFFPSYDSQQWHEQSREEIKPTQDTPGYSFIVLDKIP
ncbi:MAG: dihydrofolate reductase [Pseudomonadales bacterium]|nr:dihydrofolate reductase [Pseudomonadales bacterium]